MLLFTTHQIRYLLIVLSSNWGGGRITYLIKPSLEAIMKMRIWTYFSYDSLIVDWTSF